MVLNQARSQGERSDDPPPVLKGHFFAKCSSANILNIVRLWNRITCNTRSSAVAERPRDASCLSVVSFTIRTAQFLLLVTAASDLLVHKILLNSVLLSPIVSGGVRPKPPGVFQTNNIDIVNYCRAQFAFDLPSTVVEKRSKKFVAKYRSCENVRFRRRHNWTIEC